MHQLGETWSRDGKGGGSDDDETHRYSHRCACAALRFRSTDQTIFPSRAGTATARKCCGRDEGDARKGATEGSKPQRNSATACALHQGPPKYRRHHMQGMQWSQVGVTSPYSAPRLAMPCCTSMTMPMREPSPAA
eukprot:131495-Prymnesium_polylepis.3